MVRLVAGSRVGIPGLRINLRALITESEDISSSTMDRSVTFVSVDLMVRESPVINPE